MADDTSYVVTGALALVDKTDGTTAYVQRGGAVPVNADPEQVQHLLAVGLIAEGETGGGLAPSVPGDGSAPPAVLSGRKAAALARAEAKAEKAAQDAAEAQAKADADRAAAQAKADAEAAAKAAAEAAAEADGKPKD